MIHTRAFQKMLGVAVAAMGLQTGTAWAQPRHQTAFEMTTPEIRMPLMSQAPTIDGVIDEAEWAGADRMSGFTRYQVGDLAPQQGEFWVGADEDNLYIAVRTQTPPEGKLLKRAKPIEGGSNAAVVFADDAIEIWIAPQPEVEPAERKVYMGIFNAADAVAQAVHSWQKGDNWQGDWTVKNGVHEDWWHFEMSLPWADVGVDSPVGQTMALRVVRDWRQAEGAFQTEWSTGELAFGSVTNMPRVTWDPAAPVVQVEQLRAPDRDRIDIGLKVSNPGDQSLTATVTTRIVPTGSAATNYKETVNLAPGQSEVLAIHGDGAPNEVLDTRIEVTSADGQTTYYRRDFTWRLDRPAALWDLNPESARRIRIDFAYFPSLDALRVKADLSNFPDREQVEGISLSIRAKDGTTPIAQIDMPSLQDNVSELPRWDIPTLGEGEYELVAEVVGADAEPIVNPFVRHQFEWEGNQLGTSDILVEPFTPIQVHGNQIGVILRDHQINGLGLWDQVTADDHVLLRAPMRIEAVVDGQTVLAEGSMTATESSDTHVVVQADWQAGGLAGATKSIWDYDGVMRSELTLQPPSDVVERLTLVIPLDDAETPLLHAVTFSNKNNTADWMPEGQGTIWQSNQMPRNEFIGHYAPYIWMGSQGPGLAVFGDNDAGWITDDDVSAQEIVRRKDGVLELRLHLVQRPAQWDQPRKITLGFQATPVKPMPEGWRLWSVLAARTSTAGSLVDAPGMHNQGFFGSRVYLGGITSSSSVYPGDGDEHAFRLWDEFARLRKTGERDPHFLDEWGPKAFEKLTPERVISRTRGTLAGLISMATQPDSVLIYTNARGMRPDTPQGMTFINEWHREPFPQRVWSYGSSIDYDVDPVRSYRDSRAWYYQKSLEKYADAIYWDCVFLKPNWNPITSSAYQRPDGRVQPSAGMWSMRALVKRGAVLAQEMGKVNRNMVHMSGAAIAPINGFAATQADWELRYGDGDFQDKFPRGYIQAQTIGIQGGLVPIVILNGKFIVGTEQEASWQYRTAAGVMLSHELKTWSSRGVWSKPDPFWANYDRLVTFGYGQPGVAVYNYWQNDYPAKISGETSSLIVSKPGSAMLVLCDYGEGGSIEVKLDVDRLGLSGASRAVDVETDQPLSLSGDTLTVDLKKHDFKVIRIDNSGH